jgi:hypothetical protein
VPRQDVERAVAALHEAFGLGTDEASDA